MASTTTTIPATTGHWSEPLTRVLLNGAHWNLLLIAYVLTSLYHMDSIGRAYASHRLQVLATKEFCAESLDVGLLTHEVCVRDPSYLPEFRHPDKRAHVGQCQLVPQEPLDCIYSLGTEDVVSDAFAYLLRKTPPSASVDGMTPAKLRTAMMLWASKWQLNEDIVDDSEACFWTLLTGLIAMVGFLLQYPVLHGSHAPVRHKLLFIVMLAWLDALASVRIAGLMWPDKLHDVIAYVETSSFFHLADWHVMLVVVTLARMPARCQLLWQAPAIALNRIEWFIFAGLYIGDLVHCVRSQVVGIADVVSHVLVVFMVVMLVQRLVFMPAETVEMRNSATRMGPLWMENMEKAVVAAAARITGDSAEDYSAVDNVFLHHLTLTVMRRVIPLLAEVVSLFYLIALWNLCGIQTYVLVRSTVLAVVFSPWPELLPRPRRRKPRLSSATRDDTVGPPGDDDDEGGVILRWLQAYTPIVMFAAWKTNAAFTFLWYVAHWESVPYVLVKMVVRVTVGEGRIPLPGPPHPFQGRRAVLALLRRDVHSIIQSPFPPQQAHLFPIAKALKILRLSILEDPSIPLSAHGDHAIIRSLQNCLTQATQQANVRVRILQDQSFLPILDAVLNDLRLKLQTATQLTSDQLGYTIASTTVTDPPIYPGSSTLPNAAELRDSVEGCHWFLNLVSFLLCSPGSQDPEDFGLDKLQEFGLLSCDRWAPSTVLYSSFLLPREKNFGHPLRALCSYLPLLHELVVWREGPGEVFAAPALQGTLMRRGDLHIQRASFLTRQQIETHGHWIASRSTLAEIGAKLWTLVRDPRVASVLHLDDVPVVIVDESAFKAASSTTLDVWRQQRFSAQAFTKRLTYMVQRRFFRGEIMIVQLSQFALLLRVAWQQVGQDPSCLPQSISADGNGPRTPDEMTYRRLQFFQRFTFEENEAAYGIHIKMEVPENNAAATEPPPPPVPPTDSRIPVVLQTCNDKPVMLYMSLMVLKALEDIPIAPVGVEVMREGGLRLAVAMLHCVELVHQLASDGVPFAADRIVPLLVRILRQTKEGLADVRREVVNTFCSPQHGGVFAGDVRFIENYFKTSVGMSVVAARLVGALTRSLAAYAQCSPPEYLRTNISDFTAAVPIDKRLLRPLTDSRLFIMSDDNPDGHVEDAARHNDRLEVDDDDDLESLLPAQHASMRWTFLFRIHRAEVDLWTRCMRSNWDKSSMASFRVLGYTCVAQAKMLRDHGISTFQFPPGVRRLGDDDEGIPATDDCVICLEGLRRHDQQPRHQASGSSSADLQDWEVNMSLAGVVELAGCHHKFHAHCFFYWVCGHHLECPLCRQPLGQ